MKNLIYLLMIVFIVSCHNTKEIVKTETSVKTEADISQSKKEESKSDIKLFLDLTEKTNEADSTVVQETIFELSKPDSTGKQYAEKVTTKTTITGKSKKAEKVESWKTVEAVENKAEQTEKGKINQAVDNETKSKEIVKQAVPWKVIIMFLIIVVAVFLFLKFRHLIFKPKK